MRKLKAGNMNKENSTFEDLKVGQHGSATMYGGGCVWSGSGKEHHEIRKKNGDQIMKSLVYYVNRSGCVCRK